GSGKTWQLVTRIVRLLLDGNRPESILAITFTRKAAAEMLVRLNERLFELACLDDAGLMDALGKMQLTPDERTLARARNLYEELLCAPRTVRTSTFHAFCQDILRNFPLEADVPPGFELLDKTGDLIREAWAALFSEATQLPDGAIAKILEDLFEICSGLHGTQSLLNSFLEHRGDWWAFTQGAADPVGHASGILQGQLGIDPAHDPLMNFPAPDLKALLAEFAALLATHATQTNLKYQQLIITALHELPTAPLRYENIKEALFTGEGTPRLRKVSGVQAKALGEAGVTRILELHEHIVRALQALEDQLNSLATYRISQAWFSAGSRLLEHFQRIKAERRLLDFTDLEWQAYLLLCHEDNAHWIQYKLDQRINHLLVDEFQDTNPTQWHLLLPLLQELEAGDPERRRSVFLVGDSKQSIYRFRRAEPRLFNQAQRWLQEHLAAHSFPLATSWRSSPAVIAFVNRLFSTTALAEQLDNFTPHTTHRDYWGRVTLLPLCDNPVMEIAAQDAELRNPLRRPRQIILDQRHYQEGQGIAATILNLLETQSVIDENSMARPLHPGDIMILLRNRNHVHDYERALLEANIPFVGADRGTLLQCLEIHDMVSLLETLVTPYDNLAVATVLRSPLFGCSDEDLILLASQPGEALWMKRLMTVAADQPPGSPLARAAHQLAHWRNLAGQLPVHDLLDRIYCEGDVLYRYRCAFPDHLQHRVQANLTRFLELALEIDSGRFPSLVHFLVRLGELREHAQEAPDEAVALSGEQRVRLMTIHAAKGLEAPVVFLADSTSSSNNTTAFRALIDWPVESERPHGMHITGKTLDPYSQRRVEQEIVADQREETNLLYVAVTRARQYLFVSGCRPSKGDRLGWYGAIAGSYEMVCIRRIDKHHQLDASSLDDQVILEQHGHKMVCLRKIDRHHKMVCPRKIDRHHAPPLPAGTPVAAATTYSVDPRLGSVIADRRLFREIAPSRSASAIHTGEETPGEDGRQRGLLIHYMLEQLCRQHDSKTQAVFLNDIAARFARNSDDELLKVCWDEAVNVFRHPELQMIFDPARYQSAYSEVPIQYRQGGMTVHGIIDRLVMAQDRLLLIDYKTHALVDPARQDEIAREYYEQMHWYVEGVRRLWPGQVIQPMLLFTHTARLHHCPV
ncbi:MAG: hypothetical protein A2V90_02715, partial [Gammaproteobacteria bacterium RBG_16_57_12]